jgi:prepilin-type N-terminal cleavage/methylation domain-containing protein
MIMLLQHFLKGVSEAENYKIAYAFARLGQTLTAAFLKFKGLEKHIKGISQQHRQEPVCDGSARSGYSHTFRRQSGITLVEILVVIAVTAIIAGFAAKSSLDSSYRANLVVAEEMVWQSLRMARNSARIQERETLLVFRDIEETNQVQIDLELPTEGGTSDLFDDIRLPEGIAVVSQARQFSFDSRGLVKSPGSITFAAEDHPEEYFQINIDF